MKRLLQLLFVSLIVVAGLSCSHDVNLTKESDDHWSETGGDGTEFAGLEEETQPDQVATEQHQPDQIAERDRGAPPQEPTPQEPTPQEPTPQASEPEADIDFTVGVPQPHAHAFVVGISDYRSVTPTPGARRDAELFAELADTTLGVPSGNIEVLTDEDATRSDILATLSSLQNNVDSDGRIYFFFSGHGSPQVQSGESYLLPYEGRPETIEHSGVALDEILDSLEQTGAREVMAFVDACFSGSGDRSALPEGTRPLVPTQAAEPEGDSNVALISSSGADEISGTTEEGNQGLFTSHLLRAIGEGRADINGNGQISLDELHTYVAPRVARDARDLDRSQNPTVRVSDELGDPSSVKLLWGLPRQ